MMDTFKNSLIFSIENCEKLKKILKESSSSSSSSSFSSSSSSSTTDFNKDLDNKLDKKINSTTSSTKNSPLSSSRLSLSSSSSSSSISSSSISTSSLYLFNKPKINYLFTSNDIGRESMIRSILQFLYKTTSQFNNNTIANPEIYESLRPKLFILSSFSLFYKIYFDIDSNYNFPALVLACMYIAGKVCSP